MLGGADAQQRDRRSLGKRQSCCFPWRVSCPKPSMTFPPLAAPAAGAGGKARERPQAMHPPGVCSAARDAAGIEPVPAAAAPRRILQPLCPPQPLSLSPEHPSALPSPAPAEAPPSPRGGWRRQPPPRAGSPRGRHSPIGGVASVCRPTSWPGPNPSRKSLNWLSAPSRVVGKMNLRRGEQRAFVEHRAWGGLGLSQARSHREHGDCARPQLPSPPLRATPRCLTCRRSCCCWCCRRWTPGCLAG